MSRATSWLTHLPVGAQCFPVRGFKYFTFFFFGGGGGGGVQGTKKGSRVKLSQLINGDTLSNQFCQPISPALCMVGCNHKINAMC